MDRIVFTQNIESELSIEQKIKEHFDEIMGLYDLLGEVSNCYVEGDFDNLSFDIVLKTQKDAEDLYQVIGSEKIVNIYDKEFACDIQHNGKTLTVKLK